MLENILVVGLRSEGRLVELPPGYAAILEELKDQIRGARTKAALAVNRELVLLYWRMGRRILGQQQEERIWYIRQNITQGWSRNVLVHQIESCLYERQGRALVNFERTLPAAQSELARQILKDPCNFDFLTI